MIWEAKVPTIAFCSILTDPASISTSRSLTSILIPGNQNFLSTVPFGPLAVKTSCEREVETPSGILIILAISLTILYSLLNIHKQEAVHRFFSHGHRIVT